MIALDYSVGMKTYVFHGYSDDLAYVKPTDPTAARKGSIEVALGLDDYAVFRIEAPSGEGLYVVSKYLSMVSGTWSVGVAPLDGQHPLPDWPMKWRFGADDYEKKLDLAMQALISTPCAPYSTELEITLPDDAVISVTHPEPYEDEESPESDEPCGNEECPVCGPLQPLSHPDDTVESEQRKAVPWLARIANLARRPHRQD